MERRSYYVLDDWSLTHPSGVVERKERMIDDERSAQLLEGTYSASGARLSRSEYNYKWESWGFAMTNRGIWLLSLRGVSEFGRTRQNFKTSNTPELQVAEAMA